ncbi:hemin uptake protein HemP [Chitinibacter fontanus]|uniref:Hemin uptake protein HemP n=1 Tax=Chitinibacter fontanus TaxID=1737446 RepID=A0A7D5VB06_9NEIS|nr:hemin uptake protein HemP [Chitinibacter fontanus]QLI82591.1 hemin uptake protein HemP [Chitinibacter fontanus]
MKIQTALNSSATAPIKTLAVVQSQQLLGGQRQIVIEHYGERYVLRETSQGKLILTK